MALKKIQNGDEAADVRAGINSNVDALAQTRRPWTADYQGNYTTFNGKDYDLVPGGNPGEQPGNPEHWAEKTVTVENTATAGSLIVQRGTWDDLLAIPANTQVDEFTVEGERVNQYNENVNGPYRRTASRNQFIWLKAS